MQLLIIPGTDGGVVLHALQRAGPRATRTPQPLSNFSTRRTQHNVAAGLAAA